jgi:hypothetical protein
MTKILKFTDYSNWEVIAKNFLNEVNSLNEAEETDNDSMFEIIIGGILKKFGFNLSLVFTFGAGVKLMYPLVSQLISNMQLEIEPTTEDIVLLCITILSIMYLEHTKNPPISADDIKTKLNGEIQIKFGNPRILVNKLKKCFTSIFLFLQKFPKLIGFALTNIIDMFAYTSILLPVMNSISSFVGTYEITPDNLSGNLMSLATGIITLTGRQIMDFVKGKRTKNPISGIEDLTKTDIEDTELIKEQ